MIMLNKHIGSRVPSTYLSTYADFWNTQIVNNVKIE